MRIAWLLTLALMSQVPQDDPILPSEDACEGHGTMDAQACLMDRIFDATEKLERYLTEIRRQIQESGNTFFRNARQDLAALDEAQTAWTAYVEADCTAVYEHQEGTIRTQMSQTCELRHTQRRTHDLWETYLQGSDSGLPEPEGPEK